MNEVFPARAVSAGGRAEYRADIDGLRAIAVTGVVFFHAGLFPVASGFVGVDVFFVISGYLIGGIIVRDAAVRRFSFLRFYARRARRILPALILVVLATCLAGALLFDANEFKDIGAIGTLALVGASNINFWQFQDYFAGDSRLRTLLMTWSLGVEEQFYLVFPFIVLATMRVAPRRLVQVLGALSLASFALSLWWTQVSPVSAFYLLPARAWELGLGAMLAAAEAARPPAQSPALGDRTQNALAAAGLLALAVGMSCFDEHTPFPGTLALVPVLGTAALLASPRSWINRRLLGCRPLTFVGLVSYSWYLWHWPLMSVLRTVVPKALPPSVLLGVAAFSFGLAVLSWRFVERPFRRAHGRPGPTLVRYAVALAMVICVPVAIRASGGFPGRLPLRAQQLEATATELRHGKCLVSAGAALGTDPDCRPRADGRSVVALFGDSHAWAIGPGLRRRAEAQGFGFEIFARAACPPLVGVTVRSPLFAGLPALCTAFKTAALRAIVSDPAVATVVLVGYWAAPVPIHDDDGYLAETEATPKADGLALLRDGLTRTVDALRAAGKRVVIVQDVPDWGFDPLKIALADAISARGALARLFDTDVGTSAIGLVASTRIEQHPEVARIVSDVAAGHGQVKVWDPFPAFCGPSECVFARAGTPLFFDKDHLSPTGADLALRGLDLRGP